MAAASYNKLMVMPPEFTAIADDVMLCWAAALTFWAAWAMVPCELRSSEAGVVGKIPSGPSAIPVFALSSPRKLAEISSEVMEDQVDGNRGSADRVGALVWSN